MNTILFMALVCLLLSSFFSAAEIIIVTVNHIKLEHLKEEGSVRAAEILEMIQKPEMLLSGILVGNNIANVSCAGLATLLFARTLTQVQGLTDYIPILTSLVVTPLILFFSEIIPKNLGRRYANELIFVIDRPIRLVTFLLNPLLRVISLVTTFISTVLELEEESGQVQVSREEFVHWMKKSVDSGKVQQNTEKMIQSTIDFRETIAREIMVPLTEVRAVSSVNTRVGDLLEFARRNFFTRYPVYEFRIDQIVGYINIYDVLSHKVSEDQPVADFVQPIDYIPNTLAVDKLFYRMQKNRQKIVVVVDEYGGCDGIATIEDVMEELVGDIAEEHEEFEPMIKKLSEAEYLVDASIDLDDLNDELGLELPDGDYETLAGFLITSFERIPAEGDQYFYEEFFFEVIEMEKLAITRVRLTLTNEENQDLPDPV